MVFALQLQFLVSGQAYHKSTDWNDRPIGVVQAYFPRFSAKSVFQYGFTAYYPGANGNPDLAGLGQMKKYPDGMGRVRPVGQAIFLDQAGGCQRIGEHPGITG